MHMALQVWVRALLALKSQKHQRRAAFLSMYSKSMPQVGIFTSKMVIEVFLLLHLIL